MTNNVILDNKVLSYIQIIQFITEVQNVIEYGSNVLENNIENPKFTNTQKDELFEMELKLQQTVELLNEEIDFEDIDMSSSQLSEMKIVLGI